MESSGYGRGVRLTAAAALLSVLSGVCAAEAAERIRFARGRSTAVIHGGVPRGDREYYSLEARAGQTMTVRVTSVEKNAVFSILPPGSEKPLRGTEEERDATRWSGKLPKSGTYGIRVGATRGGAEFTLTVSIR